MTWIIGLLVVTLLVAGFLLRRAQKSPKPAQYGLGQRAPTARSPSWNQSAGVWGQRLVVGPLGACQAAMAQGGRCFPLTAVPVLPLIGCGAANCLCRLEPLVDQRRNQVDRRQRAERRAIIRAATQNGRRSGYDRRGADRQESRPAG